jgi:transcription antitermination factor NusG
MSDWHVWVINQQRYKAVEEFLESLDEIEEFLYPTVIKEYETKSGKKSKNVPLYRDYIFIKYKNNNRLFTRLESFLWIKAYLGVCSEKEVEKVEELSYKNYDEIVPPSEVIEGSRYKLIGTPFKGMSCTVVSVEGNKLIVAVKLFGSDRMIKCSIDDIDLGR